MNKRGYLTYVVILALLCMLAIFFYFAMNNMRIKNLERVGSWNDYNGFCKSVGYQYANYQDKSSVYCKSLNLQDTTAFPREAYEEWMRNKFNLTNEVIYNGGCNGSFRWC